MKIAYNPKTGAALTTAPANNDITFDLRGLNIFVRGEKFKGTDTTYSVFKKHTSAESGGYNGLVPVPSYSTTNIRFLREDGTWSVPTKFNYTELTNQDLDDYLDEGKWYYAGGSNSVTNKPSGVGAFELYVGRNSGSCRYLKLITHDSIIWFRYHTTSGWSSWVRWYTDQNTDLKVLQSATTTSNFRPLILGYNNSTDKSVLANDTTNLVYITTSIYAQPSTGSLWANKFIGKIDWSNIEGKPNSFTPSYHSHSQLQGWEDTRSVATIPNDYDGIFKVQGIKYSTTLGPTVALTGSYATIIGWRGWMDYTGGYAWEIASTDKNRLYVRSGSTTTWNNSWSAIAYTTDTYPTSQIDKLTGYSKATSDSALSTSDSLNIALGKLEYKGDLGITAYNLVNAAYDGDGTIENLKEILKVLEGIKDTETIKGLLGKYLPLAGGTMTLGEGLKFHADENYFGTNSDARIISLLDNNDTVCDGGLIIDERCTYNGTTTITELLRIRDAEFKWKGLDILHSGNSNIQNGVITINGVSITPLTAHQSLTNYVTLNTDLEITGIKAFTKQLKFTIANGTAPFLVTSKTKVTNLNVDYIEGYNINNIVRVINDNAIDVNTIQYPCIIRLGAKNSNIPSSCMYGNLLNVKMYSADTAFQLLGSYSSDLLYFRTGTWYADGTGSINTNKWRQIAFIDSDITGNAATASALYTGTVSGSTHATALQEYFNANKYNIPRNKVISFCSHAYSNTSLYIGYFNSYYNNNPYGGFFVAHYNYPLYVGIVKGEYTESTILTSYNYTNYVNITNFPGLDKTGTVTSVTVTGTNGLSGTGTVTTSGTITLSNAGVRSTTINGNYLRVNTNGINAYLTIPYATTASLLNNTYISDPSTAASGQNVKWYSPIDQSSGYAGTNYGFPAVNNANGILWLGTHHEPYGWLMGFSSNGRIYARYITDNNFSTAANGGSWNRIAWTSDIPTVTNYYWADVPISATSSTATSPTFAIATATTSITTPLVTSSGVLTLDGVSGMYLKYNSSDEAAIVLSSTYFKPFDTANNKLTLGSNSARWSNVYSVLGNYSGNITALGFVKSGSSDSYVLLGGGGHKAISDFAPSGHTHLYIATTSFKSTGKTVADYKTSIHSTLSGSIGIGKHIVVSDSIIGNWSNDSASYKPSSVASIININGYYDGSVYGQFLVSSWKYGLGLLKYTSSFENIQWFIHSGNIGTQSVNYANSAGNAASATKLTSSAGNAALPIYFSDGKPVACVASSIFSNLSNDGNNISITVAGLNRTLTVNYANSAGSVVWDNIIGKPDTFPVAIHNHDDRYVKLNGTSVMSGDLTLSLGNVDRFIVFSYPGTVNPNSDSWRTGVLGSGNGETNYYVVQYQRINTSSSTWNTAFKIGQDTGTVMFTNNITIGDKVNYHAGNLAPQTLTLSTSPQTYITVNGTNYTLKLPNSDPYTSARTPTAHTHPYLPLAGGTMNQGSHVIFPGTSTDASYGGSIEFREVDYVATNQTDWLYAPGITFHWGGRSVGKLGLRSDGDLAWRDLSIIHSGNISSQSVNYANSAGYTKRLYANSISGLTTHPGDYSLAYSRFQAGVSNIFPTINNANGVITTHLHYGDYFALIGLSSDGRMYYRTMMDLTLDAGVTWNKVAWTTDIPTKVSQLTNDSGFITGGPYLPLTGGTLSGNLTVGLKDANRIISIAGNTSHLKMVAHTNATYIESGNKDWDGNTPLLITGYSGNKGSNLYLYFANIYCRNNSYVNLDSGNWSSYITIPTLTSQLTNDSGFLTSRGYIGRTTVLATAAALSLTGIGNITPETASTYYLGASDKPWYLIFCRYFTSDLVSLSSSSNSGSLAYSSTSGYFYITANNIAANTSGGFVMKTVKNGVLSLIVLESASNYGQIKITGDLYIGGRVSNTTALISSDAAHNMYISVQGKTLLVCDSNENSIRRGKNLVDNTTLGTNSCPWESLYVENGVKLKGKTNYFSILAPNGTHSSDEIFSLPYTGGTLVTTNSPAMVKGWATYSFSYTNGTSSTYTMTFKAGGGVNIVGSPSYYEYYKGPGILIRIDNNCKDTSGGTIKDSLMVLGQASVATESLYITKTTVLVSGSTVHYYLVYCTNTSGTALTSGSGTLNFIYF